MEHTYVNQRRVPDERQPLTEAHTETPSRSLDEINREEKRRGRSPEERSEEGLIAISSPERNVMPRSSTEDVLVGSLTVDTPEGNVDRNSLYFCLFSDRFRLSSAAYSGQEFYCQPCPEDSVLCGLTGLVRFEPSGLITSLVVYRPGVKSTRYRNFDRKTLAVKYLLQDVQKSAEAVLAHEEVEIDPAGFCPPYSGSSRLRIGEICYQELCQRGLGQDGENSCFRESVRIIFVYELYSE